MRISHVAWVVAVVMLASQAIAGDFETGLSAYNSADYETALNEWQPLADAGDADGQFGLGQMYGNGFGVMMDDAAAIHWYGLAAGQGHAKAQYNLAIMHQNGWGVPQSDAEAVKLYTQAAEQGVTEAMLALGRFLSMDFAPEYDPVEAFKWYSLAALMGDIDAGLKLEAVAGSMSVEQVTEGNALVELWSGEHTDLLASH
ncbi:MAG: sel1 repeat family protein [Gammaproteobacteria bacterium]|nr:sel1 repeat family protein [Gammaproteobacteria bacterium]